MKLWMSQADGLLTQLMIFRELNHFCTSWLVHAAYAANELTALHLFTWDEQQYVLNTYSTVSLYILAVVSSCTCLIYNYSNNLQLQQ